MEYLLQFMNLHLHIMIASRTWLTLEFTLVQPLALDKNPVAMPRGSSRIEPHKLILSLKTPVLINSFLLPA